MEEALVSDGEIKLHLAMTIPGGQPVTGNVPIYYYRIRLLDDTEVGRCDLRVGEGERLRIAGHIGYSIWQEHRGHHYAAKACRLLAGVARQKGLRRLIITTSPDNIPSRRTAELAGARFLGVIDVPAGSIDYAMGQRQKCLYELDLTDWA